MKVYAGMDGQTIVKAERPWDLLRNSIATPSLVAGIMNSKYVNLLLSRIPEHLDDHDRSFLEELAPWSENLPAECRKQLN